MKTLLYPNFSKTNAYDCTKKAIDILLSLGFEVMLDGQYKNSLEAGGVTFGSFEELAERCDIIIAIGGDGTIIRASKYAAPNKKKMLGINTGRLGFMASIEAGELDKLKNLKTGEYTFDRRMMLSAAVEKAGKTESFTALNDVVVAKQILSKLPDFELDSNGVRVSRVRSDGVVFSTPTGSTAYALSAGGPIIEPDVKCIEVTQLSAHSLFTRPMIFSSKKVLTLTCKRYDSGDVILQIDGKHSGTIDEDTILTITESDDYVDIINIDGPVFYRAVNEKLMTSMK